MDQIRVVFLGTGAAAPTRTRNVSSLAIVLDGDVLLFDAGEGTQHQLMRSSVRPGSIEAVLITHLHGDHLFGLPGLLATLGLNGRDRPLGLIGPPGLGRFVAAIPYRGTPYEILITESTGGEVLRANGYRVAAAMLNHSVECIGYCVIEDDRAGMFDVARARELGVPAGPLYRQLQLGNDVALDDGRTIRSRDVVGPPRRGRRIAFCTDTRPCDAAIELARDADLLIHEATYANDHANEARERFHATAEEAARVASLANVRSLVLTHISARYDDTSTLQCEAAAIFPSTGVASDLTEIRL
jgi:ribonuclease Z